MPVRSKISVGLIVVLLLAVIFLVSLLVNKNHRIDYLNDEVEVLRTTLHCCEEDNNTYKKELIRANSSIMELKTCLDSQTKVVRKLTNQLKYNFIPVYIRDTIPCDDALAPYKSDDVSSRGF